MPKKDVTTGDIAGKGTIIAIGEHKYRVLPLTLYEACGEDGDNGEFITDNLSWGEDQGYNVFPAEVRAKLDKWMQRKLRNEANEVVDFKSALKAGWDFEDVKTFLRKLAGISG
jgi:hypothetical protein